MSFMCRHLLSERGEASQTALAQEIINAYRAMNDTQRLQFYEMLSRDFAPDQASILRAAADYQSAPGPHSPWPRLSAAVESPRQELFRRINTAPRGTETLVAMREHYWLPATEISQPSMSTCGTYSGPGSTVVFCVSNASAGTHRL